MGPLQVQQMPFRVRSMTMSYYYRTDRLRSTGRAIVASMRIDRIVGVAALVVAGGVVATSQTQPPQQPPANTSPAVSPDGRHVAFVSTRDGNADLFVVPAAGGAERQLTRTPESEGRPEWSADGSQLAYGIAASETTRLFTLDVASAAARQIGSVHARGAAVSPDLTRVAYTAGTWQASRLGVARIDGSAEQLLTTPEQSSISWNPRFSRDGRHVAFTGQDVSRQLHVFVVPAAGGDVRQLTKFTAEEGRAQVPAWSFDGQKVAFQLSRKGSSDVWVANRDGSGMAAVIRANGAELHEVPAWFPDGRRIAYQSTRSGRMEIWTINVDGSDAKQVTQSAARPAAAYVRSAAPHG
jgi:TolB protein